MSHKFSCQPIDLHVYYKLTVTINDEFIAPQNTVLSRTLDTTKINVLWH